MNMAKSAPDMREIFVEIIKSAEVKEEIIRFANATSDRTAKEIVSDIQHDIAEIKGLLSKVGLDLENPKDQYADLAHLRKWRLAFDKGASLVGTWILTAIIVGLAALVGLKNFK
jgi:hypothetical protein